MAAGVACEQGSCSGGFQAPCFDPQAAVFTAVSNAWFSLVVVVHPRYTAFHITGTRETCGASVTSYLARIRKVPDPASALCRSRSCLTRFCSMQCSAYGNRVPKGKFESALVTRRQYPPHRQSTA